MLIAHIVNNCGERKVLQHNRYTNTCIHTHITKHDVEILKSTRSRRKTGQNDAFRPRKQITNNC